MKVIGLCGGSGSGKGTVASVFSEFDIPSIDTDAVYHSLTAQKSPCLDALTDEFGDEILASDGSLNRQKLSEIVFLGDNSEQKRRKLNQITHKFVLEKTRKILAEYRALGKKAALVDAPLLFESGFDKECDFVLSISAPEDVRIARIQARDGIDEQRATARVRGQKGDEFYRAASDAFIYADGDEDQLFAKALAAIGMDL